MSIKSAKVMALNELLRLIHRAGYMRCFDLSQFTKKELPIIVKLVKTLLKLKLIVSRTLPEAAGEIYYLSTKGSERLQEHGVQVTGVYKLEKLVDDEWKSTNDWKHHFMSLGAIFHLIYEISDDEPLGYFFEREVRRACLGLEKYPDGLIIDSATSGTWIEVERSEKGGDDLHLLCNTIIKAKNDTLPMLFDRNFNAVMLCVEPDAKKSGTHHINHIQRVRNKLETIIKQDVNFYIAYMAIDHYRVLSIQTGDIHVQRNEAKLILERLEIEKWLYDDYFSDNINTLGVYCCDWGAHYTCISDKKFFWEVGIIDYDYSYDHNGPMAYSATKRHVEEGLDVFESGYATSATACKTAITEALAPLVLNGIFLDSITEFM